MPMKIKKFPLQSPPERAILLDLDEVEMMGSDVDLNCVPASVKNGRSKRRPHAKGGSFLYAQPRDKPTVH